MSIVVNLHSECKLNVDVHKFHDTLAPTASLIIEVFTSNQLMPVC